MPAARVHRPTDLRYDDWPVEESDFEYDNVNVTGGTITVTGERPPCPSPARGDHGMGH
jgi:hypothetical protein